MSDTSSSRVALTPGAAGAFADAIERRAKAIIALREDPFDVLVIGGGITGAGVARDAAMRGMRVALVEQDDFASGTSSRSSRLVHGGVRYLEHGALRMVFESSRERRTLLRIAPHLVRPLSFTWPVYRGARVARWKLAAGLTLYDLLSLMRNVGRHRRLSSSGVRKSEPRLRADGLAGGARYWDASTDDARLTLATIRSAIAAGAVVVNHARVDALRVEDGRVTGAHVRADGARVEVRARVVVNATGPWSDRVEELAGAERVRGVRGSKGVHVNVPRERVGNHSALTLIAPQDGRVTFVLPAGAFTIIGTTDTYDDVAPESVHATASDVRYLLDVANHYFPDARLVEGDVVSAWAGLRPLAAPATAATTPGGGDAGDASREHNIAVTRPGLVRVTGGKLTTYRSMASEVVDVVERALGRGHVASGTAQSPLVGGDIMTFDGEVRAASAVTGDAQVAERLVHAHGSEWREVWRGVEGDASLAERIEPALPCVIAELQYAVQCELACTLGDLMIRRTPVAFETRDHGRAAARRVASIVAPWLGWSEEQRDGELVAFDAEVERMFGVRAGETA